MKRRDYSTAEPPSPLFFPSRWFFFRRFIAERFHATGQPRKHAQSMISHGKRVVLKKGFKALSPSARPLGDLKDIDENLQKVL